MTDPAERTILLGPQYSKDDPFTRRMRLHQSWYRAEALGVDCGHGPTKTAKNRFGNMLTLADGAAGKNFLTPQIHGYAEQRVAEGIGAVEEYRLRHNLLSSQPMCFNLFGPLHADLDLATRLTRALWGERVHRVTRVDVEWAPTPKEEYLNDKTAFDAFVEYETPDGGWGFVGIETKLTEPFSQKRTDKAEYRRWMGSESPWRLDAHGRVHEVQHNQLWRDHLLAWSLLRHPSSKYKEGRLAVVHHSLDERCSAVLAGYRQLLCDESTLVSHTLEDVLQAWLPCVATGSWLEEFRVRYCDLACSEHCVGSL